MASPGVKTSDAAAPALQGDALGVVGVEAREHARTVEHRVGELVQRHDTDRMKPEPRGSAHSSPRR
jgi:hypothetical protein